VPRLDSAACKLLKDHRLVERFNAVHAVLEEAVRELPKFGERQIVTEVVRDLERLGETMQKDRFSIGFIGPSQIGKSMTVSNLLSVPENDAPSPQGGGGPTTSVPTRLVPLPPAEGARHGLTLCYFSKEEFRRRVRDICDLVRVQYDDDLRRLRESVQRQQDEQPHFKAADHIVLLGLLDAALKFPDYLGDTSREEKGDYAQRRKYATHQDGPSQYRLLREVKIEFVTDAISPEIEMIDLPGLGVDKESDARLTLAFLHELDGAFMFQSGLQVKDGAVSQLAEKMREQYARTLGERIWMVVTFCEMLNDVQLHGPADIEGQPSMFCHLAEAMRQQGIHEGNVIFVGNGYYQSRMAAGLSEQVGVPEDLRSRYPRMLRFDDGGEPVVPERCGRNAGQIGPWKQFVLDSGIPALRATMQTRVADAVRLQVCRDASERLGTVIERLKAALSAAEQQSGMTVDEMFRAARWSGQLDSLVDDVGRDPKFSQPAVSAITEKLGSVISSWGEPSRGGLADNHQHLAGMLMQAGMHEAATQTEAVVAEVRREIEKRVQEEPPPAAAGLETPLEHWAAAVEQCLAMGKTSTGQEFRGPVFRGLRDDPSPLDGGGQNMSGDDYLVVMRAKVGRAARVFVSRLVSEIQGHLHRLQGRYRALGSEMENIDQDKRERYARYRAELERLRA